MKVFAIAELPLELQPQQQDKYYTGAQLKNGDAPEGVYRYVTRNEHSEQIRYILMKSINSSASSLLLFNPGSRNLLPGNPNNSTVFELTDKRVHLAFSDPK